MNNEVNIKIDDEFDTAFESIPSEVEDFMWSDAYTVIIDAIQKVTNLTDAQKLLVRNESYDLLLGIKTMANVAVDLLKELQPDVVAKVLYCIDTQIISRVENITEFYTPIEEVDQKNNSDGLPMRVDNLLIKLNQSFTTPTTIAPVKRDYSVTKQDSSTTVSKPAVDKKVDPYREQPEL